MKKGKERKPAESGPRASIWSMREAETSKSFEAFGIYLRLGPRRSLDAARRGMGKIPGYVRQLEKWSSQHAWVKRAEAFDAHEVGSKLALRSQDREKFRQGLVDELDPFRRELVAIALGRCTCDADPAHDTPHREASCALFASPRDRLAALREAIALAGIAAPKRIEVTGESGGPLKFERDLDHELVNLTDAQLDVLEERLSGVGR